MMLLAEFWKELCPIAWFFRKTFSWAIHKKSDFPEQEKKGPRKTLFQSSTALKPSQWLFLLLGLINSQMVYKSLILEPQPNIFAISWALCLNCQKTLRFMIYRTALYYKPICRAAHNFNDFIIKLYASQFIVYHENS